MIFEAFANSINYFSTNLALLACLVLSRNLRLLSRLLVPTFSLGSLALMAVEVGGETRKGHHGHHGVHMT